jgi:hypothetical protein
MYRRFNINEQPLCEGVRRVIFPRQALNLRNEWKYGRSIPTNQDSIFQLSVSDPEPDLHSIGACIRIQMEQKELI